MEIIEIIKDSFMFPSKNIRPLGIFIILSLVAGILIVAGSFMYLLGLLGSGDLIVFGGIFLIIAGLIGLVTSGYQISIIKSGIELQEEAPDFVWWDNFNTGFDNLIVSIVYFIIPAFITVLVGYLTNIVGNFLAVIQEIITQVINVGLAGNSIDLAVNAISQSLANLIVSITVTITVGIIVFVIFYFFQTMAEARLAKTNSLTEALNVFEAAKDIRRIGIAKVIAVILIVLIIVCIIESIFSFIYGFVPLLSILSLIITPYLAFFTQRAIGLLYSDIA